jgi:hypothetical protein
MGNGNVVTPGVLGGIHGPIRRRQQLIEVQAMLGMGGHAHGDREAGQQATTRHWDLAHRQPRALPDPRCLFGAGRVQEDDELLAAQTHHGVGAAHRCPELHRDPLQEKVSGSVAGAVVDHLEMIEVEEEQGDGLPISRGATEVPLGGIPQPAAVVEVGQRIGHGGIEQLDVELGVVPRRCCDMGKE